MMNAVLYNNVQNQIHEKQDLTFKKALIAPAPVSMGIRG
jgi:hypothetical protein